VSVVTRTSSVRPQKPGFATSLIRTSCVLLTRAGFRHAYERRENAVSTGVYWSSFSTRFSRYLNCLKNNCCFKPYFASRSADDGNVLTESARFFVNNMRTPFVLYATVKRSSRTASRFTYRRARVFRLCTIAAPEFVSHAGSVGIGAENNVPSSAFDFVSRCWRSTSNARQAWYILQFLATFL